jgi:RimJ/RimL family protein N-acetyltransferase
MTATLESPVLQGSHVRLEPLSHRHIDGLSAAAAADPSLYRWTTVPQGKEEVGKYVDAALASKNAGTAVPFATVRVEDSIVIGSTRFFDLERLPWPKDHEYRGRQTPDVCEIGYTWLTRSAIQTPANTEAKFLMLRHAFEVWQVFRVCLHTDARNQRSRAAMERIGAQFEGILRAYRLAVDYSPRDSARYSIVAAEWPTVKAQFSAFLERN